MVEQQLLDLTVLPSWMEPHVHVQLEHELVSEKQATREPDWHVERHIEVTRLLFVVSRPNVEEQRASTSKHSPPIDAPQAKMSVDQKELVSVHPVGAVISRASTRWKSLRLRSRRPSAQIAPRRQFRRCYAECRNTRRYQGFARSCLIPIGPQLQKAPATESIGNDDAAPKNGLDRADILSWMLPGRRACQKIAEGPGGDFGRQPSMPSVLTHPDRAISDFAHLPSLVNRQSMVLQRHCRRSSGQ
jgi:hypothetical protein